MQKNLISKSNIESNAENIALDQSIVLTFVENMLPETLTTKCISLIELGGSALPITLDYKKMTKVLTITPAVKFSAGTSYLLTVMAGENGPKSAFENELIRNYSIQFKTLRQKEVVEEKTDTEPEKETAPIKTPVEEIPETEQPVRMEGELFLKHSYPKAGAMLESSDTILLLFSNPVDPMTIEKSIYLLDASTDPIIAEIIGLQHIPTTIEISDKNDSLVTITPLSPLSSGKDYKVVLSSTLKAVSTKIEPLVSDSFTFTKSFKYFYTTISSVQAILGEYASSFEDSRVSRMIAEISNQIRGRYSRKKSFVESEWENDTVNPIVSEYVKYKVSYMLILNITVKENSSQLEEIHLGDLSVAEKVATTSGVVSLLGLLKKELVEIEDELEKEKTALSFAKMGTAVRAQSSTKGATYPSYFTRTPFKELGGA